MATVVYNPTDLLPKAYQEIFNGHYKGVGKNIKPGDKIKMDDPAANHLLNEFGPRGLVSLNYGDEDKLQEIIDGALKRNRDYKIKQVEELNQRNESRKTIGLPYLIPTDKLKLYAEELGEDLIQPYRIKDAEKQRVTDVEKENIALREQIKGMNDKFDLLLAQMGHKPVETKETVDPDLEETLNEANEQEDIPSHVETPIGRLKNKGGRPRKKG